MALLVDADVEYLVVNYGGDAGALLAMVSDLPASVRLIQIRVDGFNKSRALNVGLHFSTAPCVLLLDADVVLVDFDLTEATASVQSGHWITLGRVEESDPTHRNSGELRELAFQMELVLSNGRMVRIETSRRYLNDRSRSAPGILFAARSALCAVGGFHSELVGWGWEDIDIQVRLSVLGLERMQVGRGLHLTHGDDHRYFVGQNPSENNARNQSLCLARYDSGDFLGTLDSDCRILRLLPSTASAS